MLFRARVLLLRMIYIRHSRASVTPLQNVNVHDLEAGSASLENVMPTVDVSSTLHDTSAAGEGHPNINRPRSTSTAVSKVPQQADILVRASSDEISDFSLKAILVSYEVELL